MGFHKEQGLNEWVEMLHAIYGLSQNYSRSEYEILCHLSEVTGAFSKYLFKLNQPGRAKEFLPKMFGWAVALVVKVKGSTANLEEVLLKKYPCRCSYCVAIPCRCVPGRKSQVNEAKVREAYVRWAPSQGRTVNEFQMLFRRLYAHSWKIEGVERGSLEAVDRLRVIYSRMIEELSELGEAVRFSHLYPSNFDNELADYIAWLFALISCLHAAEKEGQMYLASDLFWPAYPGICVVCMLDRCDCRPSPVRELQSKPALDSLQFIDGLTQAGNTASFQRTLSEVESGSLPFPTPISCVRLDVDGFKRFNESPFNHSVGDAALRHAVNAMRLKVRARDRVFRVGGDEFAIFCPDLSAREAEGMILRIATYLKEKPVPFNEGVESAPPSVTFSVGIAECHKVSRIKACFAVADEAAIRSKNEGKDRVAIAEPSDHENSE